MRKHSGLLLLLCPLLAVPASAQADSRRHDLEVLLDLLVPSRTPPTGRINALDRTWDAWVRRTGALPPDFDALPSIAGLPDPLVMREGGRTTPIATVDQWNRHKPRLRQQVEKWIFGRMPPAPDNLRATVTSQRQEGSVTVREVLLEFGPGHKAKLRLHLLIPDGKGPFPVFLTNHGRNRPWMYTAVNRGYIACYYAATDPRYGDVDDSDSYIEIYPEFDFSCLGRWAWSASRAVDYLVGLPEVAKGQIGLTGHSRNGKQALLAAAFDERIGAVIPSSGNTGEIIPWRYNTNPYAIESIALLTGAQPHWFHPRLRFFAGREHKLPVDQHTLLAMVAPRGLMMYSGYAESAANPFGFEQAYRSALSVYRLHKAEQNLWLHLREGEHGTQAADIENFIDFFDSVFQRKPRPKSETWILGYDFNDWKKLTGERIDPLSHPVRTAGDFTAASKAQWRDRQDGIRKNIAWALGEPAPRAPFQGKRKLSDTSWSAEGWMATLFNRPAPDAQWQTRLRASGMGIASVPFGDGLAGTLFYPVDAAGNPKAGQWPVAVWLHPYAYAYGWSARSPWSASAPDYHAEQRPSFASLTRRGIAVLAFDQIGFGSRLREAARFYQRYPKWSLMGKMVADTSAAVEALATLEEIDPARVYLMGYSLGAKVGLITAALDPRVKAVAAVAGFDPLRLDRPDPATEGLRHYSHLHGLIPRFGFFLGHELRLPFDFVEAAALIAPRPALIVAPTLDRYAPVEEVRREMAHVRKIYGLLGRENALALETPVDFNRFSPQTQERVFDWLAAQ